MVLSAEPQLRSKQNGYWQNVSALEIYEKKMQELKYEIEKKINRNIFF